MSTEDHRAYAEEAFKQNPEYFPIAHRPDILKGVITQGMTPAEAHLAGGAFNYEVVPDPKVWESNVNPLAVLRAQTTAPDDSEIWMAFSNTTQFSSTSSVHFKVYFARGLVDRIVRN